VKLAPRKPDWDLKRGVAKKLEKLERRTQRAIAELIRMLLSFPSLCSPAFSTWTDVNYIQSRHGSGWPGGQFPTLNFSSLKTFWFLYKNTKFGAGSSHCWEFGGEIEILSTHDLLCWRFALWWKMATSVHPTFLTHDAADDINNLTLRARPQISEPERSRMF